MIRMLLLPFSILYGIGVAIRNLLYDTSVIKSEKFNFPIILIGNLSTGGTGKTPVVMKIAQHLGDNCNPVILSRGYKRKTSGLVFADNSSGSVDELGDEPAMYHNLLPFAKVVVSEDRASALKKIHEKYVNSCAVIMDDGYQHRKVNPGLKVLLTSYHKPFYNDYLLPGGDLREFRSASKRATVIVVTKCPASISDDEKNKIIQKLKVSKHQHVFFATNGYNDLIDPIKQDTLHLNNNKNINILCVTGIADPTDMHRYLNSKTKKLTSITFSDHHSYNKQDIEKIKEVFNSINGDKKIIITTQKDINKLQQAGLKNVTDKLYVLPISVNIQNEQDFFSLINKYVTGSSPNS
jgi:tetraacyldisaccharide 4'-kinase